MIEQEKIITPRTAISRARSRGAQRTSRSQSPINFVYSDSEIGTGYQYGGTSRKRSNSFHNKTTDLIQGNPHQSLIGDSQPKAKLKPVKRYVIRQPQVIQVAPNNLRLVQQQPQPVAVVNPNQTTRYANQPNIVFTEENPTASLISARKQILPNNNIMMVPYQPDGFQVVKADELKTKREPDVYSVKSPTIIDVKPGKSRVKSPTDSDDYYNKQSKKLLSGFHPYYDKETDILALQCCTCCIGCWRRCSRRCTGCENFMSCPIYCWICILLPIFILLIGGLVVSSLYAAKVIG